MQHMFARLSEWRVHGWVNFKDNLVNLQNLEKEAESEHFKNRQVRLMTTLEYLGFIYKDVWDLTSAFRKSLLCKYFWSGNRWN